jgi:hypothetical protein
MDLAGASEVSRSSANPALTSRVGKAVNQILVLRAGTARELATQVLVKQI